MSGDYSSYDLRDDDPYLIPNSSCLVNLDLQRLIRLNIKQLLPFRGLGSGVNPALQAWPQTELQDHRNGNEFRAVITRAKTGAEQVTDPVGAPVEASVEIAKNLTDTEFKILNGLKAQPLARKEILQILGYSQPTGNYKIAISTLLNIEAIEYTIPDKPNSRLQKYRLTGAGKTVLDAINNDK